MLFGLDFTSFKWDLSNPIILGITITIAGWIVTGMYAFVNQWQNMKRQLILDVAKIKLENTHKSSNDYIILGSCVNEIYQLGEPTTEKDKQLAFYYLCKFFKRYYKIVEDFGGFELDTLEAEQAISYLVRDIFAELEFVLEYESFSDMTNLITSEFSNEEINFSQFLPRIINPENIIFTRFLQIICDENNRERMSKYFHLLSRLLEFEVNYSYKLWYKQEPVIELDEYEIDYLLDKKLKTYTIRLKSSGKKLIVKQFYKLYYSSVW